MRRNSFINIPQAPPTGTDAPPPAGGCDRIDTDQNGVEWEDMPQPYDETSWVRGETSLAIGKFENYAYHIVTGGLDQFLILGQVTGAFVDAENLQIATSALGPWTDAGIDTDTPVDQTITDCDIACIAAECQGPGGGGEGPFIVGPEGDPDDNVEAVSEEGATRFGPWTTRYSYDTTLPGGSALPFRSGSVTGQTTLAVANISHWLDPFPSPGNLRLVVDGVSFGRNTTRFIHGETLDHGRSTGQVTLSNPMFELGPLSLPVP